jgi:adenosylhomocysteine nucleosidase
VSAERGARAKSGQFRKVLVCFAVKEEAAPFRKAAAAQEGVPILITGMGQSNAQRSIQNALLAGKPDLVLTCGFGGGLRPELETGVVLYETDGDPVLNQRLEAAGARPGRFLFSSRVATTSAEKRALWEQSKADAVEMESQTIRTNCREQGIPCATVRVVLDAADEDLPLDFNRLMTPDRSMSYGKLAEALVRSPGKIAALLRLQKQSRSAAEKLAAVLTALLNAVLLQET